MVTRQEVRSWLINHPEYNPYKLSKEKFWFPFRLVTNYLRVLPDFIIIGASRCGTTSLYYNMIKHPNIYPGATKASSFFDKNFEKGLNFYKSHFPAKIFKKHVNNNGKQNFITGEATTTYLLNPLVAERISQTLPNIKLIALLRNPIDRAYSHFNYHLIRGEAKFSSFEEAIKYEEDLIKLGDFKKNIFENKKIDYRFCSYLSEGTYIDRLLLYTKYFSKNQILVIKTKDFISDEKKTLNQVFEFLGLPKYKILQPKKLNVVRYENMKTETREYLRKFFRPCNEKLSNFLNSNFHWD